MGRPRWLGGALVALAAPVASAQCARETFLYTIPGYTPGGRSDIDLVYDHSRGLVFVATYQGAIDRIDVAARTLLPRWRVGRNPTAIDISPDGAFVLVSEQEVRVSPGARHAVVYKVNADTGAVGEITWRMPTTTPYGVHDLVVMNNGNAYVTPVYTPGSCNDYLREIELSTSVVRRREDVPFSGGRTPCESPLIRSPSGGHMIVGTGPELAVLDAATNTFGPVRTDYLPVALDGPGTMILATFYNRVSPRRLHLLDRDFFLQFEFQDEDVLAGAFDPTRDYFYFAKRGQDDHFITVSRSTMQVLDVHAAAQDFDATPRLVVSDDGAWAFAVTRQGVLQIELRDACYADCDCASGRGVLDIFDFLCFQNRFAAGDRWACDCDIGAGQGVCDVFDFLCFQNAFAGGCP